MPFYPPEGTTITGIDSDGNEIEISVDAGGSMKVNTSTLTGLMRSVLKELKKTNLLLSLVFDQHIENADIEE